jgi:hypothetical protein
MIRILVIILILVAVPAFAGWKMYAPGQKEPVVSSVDDPNAPKPLVEVIEASVAMPALPQRSVEPEDNFDLSGIEWRRTRGLYSGKRSDIRIFHYRA